MRDQALNDFGLEGTPTFYVNGKQLTGEKTLDQLDADHAAALTALCQRSDGSLANR